MFTIHLKQPSRLVIKSFSSSSSVPGDNQSNVSAETVHILQGETIISVEPIQQNQQQSVEAGVWSNETLTLPTIGHQPYGSASEYSCDRLSLLSDKSDQLNEDRSVNRAIVPVAGHEKFLSTDESEDIKPVALLPSQIGSINGNLTSEKINENVALKLPEENAQEDSDIISLISDGGTTDVSEFTSDEEIAIKKRALSICDNEQPKKKKFSSVAQLSNKQLLLSIHPEVHVLKLPDFLINSGARASELDQIFSSLQKSVSIRNTANDCQHEQDDSGDELFTLPKLRQDFQPTIPIQFPHLEEDSDEEDDESFVQENLKLSKQRSKPIHKKKIEPTSDHVESSDDPDETDSDSTEIGLDDENDIENINHHEIVNIKNTANTNSDKTIHPEIVATFQEKSPQPEVNQSIDVNLAGPDLEAPETEKTDLNKMLLNNLLHNDLNENELETSQNKKISQLEEPMVVVKTEEQPDPPNKETEWGLMSNDLMVEKQEKPNEMDGSDLSTACLITTKEKSKRKNIKRVWTEAELEKATNAATTRERKRVERITKQEIKYSKILPTIVTDKDEPRLILDLNTKTNEVRVEVDSILVKELKPHQLDGIKFMYNSTIGSVDKLTKKGSGCILAHCMGLGKTLQVIAFVQTLLSNQLTKDHIKTILIAVPVNTLKNWVEEFDKWITNNGLKTFEVHEMVNETNIEKRLKCLALWKSKGGVLIIGHSLLANLLHLRDAKKSTFSSSTIAIVEEHLTKPGPDLLIIDEGHRLKNPSTRICKAVVRMKTKRKIMLTGTPLQNNLNEYHTMINIIKPRLLGSKKEFANRFLNPIENGQKADSNEADVKLMAQRSAVLHQLLSGCIQRFGFETLKPFLQPKYEYTLYIRPSKRITEMYNFYLDNVTCKTKLLWDAANLRLCVNHPALYEIKHENEKAKKRASAGQTSSHCEDNSDDNMDQETETDEPEDNTFKNDWYRKFIKPGDQSNFDLSGKFILLFKILKSCISVGDKLVVVSQSLETLDLIEKSLQLIKKIAINDEEKKIKWTPNKHYFRIDGGVAAKDRHDQLTKFNDPANKKARLFLLSTKAGGIGINLTGANRCIIFDVSWNPSDDKQAIFRVFRLGQTKPVHVYRFVTKDTIEEIIFRKQIVKLGMSIRVLDKTQVKRAYKAAEVEEYYNLRPRENYEISSPVVSQDRFLACIQSGCNEVLEWTEYDSLLEKNPEEELTEDERKKAWAEYQRERETEVLVCDAIATVPEYQTAEKAVSLSADHNNNVTDGESSTMQNIVGASTCEVDVCPTKTLISESSPIPGTSTAKNNQLVDENFRKALDEYRKTQAKWFELNLRMVKPVDNPKKGQTPLKSAKPPTSNVCVTNEPKKRNQTPAPAPTPTDAPSQCNESPSSRTRSATRKASLNAASEKPEKEPELQDFKLEKNFAKDLLESRAKRAAMYERSVKKAKKTSNTKSLSPAKLSTGDMLAILADSLKDSENEKSSTSSNLLSSFELKYLLPPVPSEPFDETKIPENWLRVDDVSVKRQVIVKAKDKDGNYQTISEMEQIRIAGSLAPYQSMVHYLGAVGDTGHGIESFIVDVVNEKARLNIMQVLKVLEDNPSINHKLEVSSSKLRYPIIKFESREYISNDHHSRWIKELKIFNGWNQHFEVNWKLIDPPVTFGVDRYHISISISPKLRDMIQRHYGTISLGDRRVKVTDVFGIVQCTECWEYCHNKNTCDRPKRCKFCSSETHFLDSECEIKDKPDQWFCHLCDTKGHSAISKSCPVLVKNLQKELKKVDYCYSYVFLDNDRLF